MRERSFLVLLGWFLPAAIAGAAALSGCGSVAVATASGGTGAQQGAGVGGGGTGGEPADASSGYVDPGCPDAGPTMTDFACDPFHQDNGDCPSGQGCYIFAMPPSTPCGQEVFGAVCVPEGAGKQGAACSGPQECSGGFTCVVSGSGDQCTQLCALSGSNGCPEGMVCEPIDVQGFGGCM